MDEGFTCLLACYGLKAPTGAYAGVVLVVQVVSKLLKWKLKSQYKGVVRLVMVYVLTMLVALVLLPLCKLNLFQAFIHANLLAYAQVFGHQLYKGFKEFKR